jgi:hypothetical protein
LRSNIQANARAVFYRFSYIVAAAHSLAGYFFSSATPDFGYTRQ